MPTGGATWTIGEWPEAAARAEPVARLALVSPRPVGEPANPGAPGAVPRAAPSAPPLPARRGGPAHCRQLLADLLRPGWPLDAEARAEQLIDAFDSLPSLVAADEAAVAAFLGESGRPIAAFLSAVKNAQLHALRREIDESPLLGATQALLDYLHVGLAWSSSEQFRVLYLNAGNRLLRDEIVATGTPDEVTVQPRALIKRALELGATAIILVHNHPSGRADPSPSDIQTTARIVRAAKALDIAVHDHIIIARSAWRSFRQSGLLV